VAPIVALVVLEQRRGNWPAVAGYARQAIQRSPEELFAWVALAEALEQMGQGEAAEGVAKQCIERFPESADAHAVMAKALRAQGDTDGALVALDRAQTLEPSPELQAERILTLGIGGRVPEGVAEADAALEAAPDSAVLHAASASLRFAAGDVAGGDAATERALALEPDEPRPLRVRCEFRASRQDWDGARDDCTRYLDVRPDDAGTQFVLGVAHQSLGESADAEQAYRRAMALDERDVRSRNNLAELLAQGGDLDGALVVAQEAYRLEEGNPYLLDTLGGLYLRNGLATRAVPLLEQAHAGLPEHPGVTLNLAMAYRDAGRGGEAGALIGELDGKLPADHPLRGRVEEVKASLP
jgi:tetratricopeptide (TPR) repeat protein